MKGECGRELWDAMPDCAAETSLRGSFLEACNIDLCGRTVAGIEVRISRALYFLSYSPSLSIFESRGARLPGPRRSGQFVPWTELRDI